MGVLLKLAIVLVAGLIGGRLARMVKLPEVTGYLLAGLFLGPSLFHLITPADTESFSVISDVALAAIAFSIGSEFLVRDMKKLGKAIIIITLFEVIGAIFVVFFVVRVLFGQPFALSIVIASMSAATAPAATLMVIRQYRASGPLSKAILPVVALDDVFGIIAFGIAISVAKLSAGHVNDPSFMMFLQPFIEIIGSLGLGVVFGLLLLFVSKRANSEEETLNLILTAIALSTGTAMLLGWSPLLACIMAGTVIFNFLPGPVRIQRALQSFTPPVYLLFFTLAGASLDLKILSEVGLLGIAYIFARAGGKILGAWVGARAAKAEDAIRKNLGFALLPQGGISIGLSVIVRQQLPEYAVPIITVIMFSVLVFETSGPIFAKIAIKRAGEIGGMDRERNLRAASVLEPDMSPDEEETAVQPALEEARVTAAPAQEPSGGTEEEEAAPPADEAVQEAAAEPVAPEAIGESAEEPAASAEAGAEDA